MISIINFDDNIIKKDNLKSILKKFINIFDENINYSFDSTVYYIDFHDNIYEPLDNILMLIYKKME